MPIRCVAYREDIEVRQPTRVTPRCPLFIILFACLHWCETDTQFVSYLFNQGIDMKKNRLTPLGGLLMGISLTIPLAQAGDLIMRSEVNTRPFALTDPQAKIKAVNRDVQVFVRFDLPSVAEFNAQALRAGGAMPDAGAQRAHAAQVSAQHAAMRSQLASLGATELSALRVGANGMRVKVNSESLAALEQLSNVRSVAPVTRHTIDNAQSVPWIGTQAFWDTVGTGEGISIGVIDSGIDYTHANMGGSGDPDDYANNDPDVIEAGTFPNAKVVGGFDFVGTDYDGTTVPIPDDDPLDEDIAAGGHGSHVAGTAAGLGVDGIIGPGVAKGADLYGLKVFGATGFTTVTSDAIEWAMDPNGDGDMSDHLDVINMSLGSSFGGPNDPSAIATQAAADLGIIVATSAGNSGGVPYVTGSPGVADGAISTAASTKGGDVLGIEVHGDVNDTIEAIEGTGPVQLIDGSVSGGLVQPDASDLVGCSPIAVDMTGAVALISRGACSFDLKFQNAEAAGAVGVVVYNDGADPSRVAPIVMGGIGSTAPVVSIPGVMIPSTQGQDMSGQLTGGASIDGLLDAGITTPTAFADLIAGFSSRGPGHGGSAFKPDVTNPGVGIISTGRSTGTGVLTLQGTSMASPHTAGVGALLRQLHGPGLHSSAIKAILQNSTTDMADLNADIQGGPLPLSHQGTGRVDVVNAMSLSSYAAPGGVSFGRLNPPNSFSRTRHVTVTNLAGNTRQYHITHVPNQTLAGVDVKCGPFVQVPGHSSNSFPITITLDPSAMDFDNPSFTQSEVDGWCVASDGTDDLRVGYMAAVDPASRMGVIKVPGAMRVHNNGGEAAGFAEGFTLSGVDGLFLDGTNNAIAAVGFRTADINLFGIPVVEMGVASEAIWESPSTLDWNFLIDVDRDGVADFQLLGIDFSAFQGPIGSMITAQFDATGAGFLDWFITVMDYNDHVAAMPFTTVDGGGFVPGSFDYTLILTGGDGSIDVQVGTVDLSQEVVPSINSFGLLGGGSVDVTATGPRRGDMLWLFQNNKAPNQFRVINNVP